ncbi:hypothetical protein PRZ48_011310 [Zasmidium cellare]|uniref:AB hydrolase-1 domain-containing protein n=1 Tax=Zasmidium cellare TaxID=395010 RepID=A0ABR0E611_ZASCE|nr:hypothetical protein PRZ48_011310 [Zasmidium cellare]
MASNRPQDHRSGNVRTSDGVELAYDQHGESSKPSIIFLPGWCQTALQWRKQYEDLGQHFHVTTYDYRGHGSSEKTNRGYRIARFAADLNDILVRLNLNDVTLVGHSMGCSVMWSFWDIFVTERHRIKSLILVDQTSCMLPRPGWSEEQAKEIGTLFTQQSLDEFAIALQSDARATMSQFVPAMFTDKAAKEDVAWTLERNLMIDSKSAATLLLDHVKNDWRDVLETINVPTLVVGATGSFCPMSALDYLVAHIPGARLVAIEKEEGGSHFMFWESPEKFNALVRRFIGTGEVST